MSQHPQPDTIAHSPTPIGPTTSAQHPQPQTHLMVTRAQVGTVKPNPRFNFHTSHISPLPKSPIALSDPNWCVDMYDEYNALVKNNTWILVLKPPNANVVRSMWLFRHKYHSDGSLSRCDSSLFIYHHGTEIAYLLIYVDDIVPTASSTDLLQRIISSLHKEFAMSDLGALNYFLGISVTHDSIGMFLSQKKYALELLDKAHMANCNPTQIPVGTKSKLGSDGDLISDPTLYRSLAGSLVAYTDADWAGCPTTRRSTSGYCVFLQDNLLSWSAKRKHTLYRSSAEAEYRCVANVVTETAWLRNLLRELHTPLFSITIVYYDNVSVIYMTANPIQYQRTKHIEIDIHFVRDMIARGQVRILHVPSRYQLVLPKDYRLRFLRNFVLV
uniref:Ribonuclease H-like domain-containing protein n=1 Tax=Tanacetum cinerariifolium TaxID=118510 RepID=A0A6L2JF19_TANCI|nr:ribonuclease H-like domain-containing protein [Tanacetum cinerariifolium]